MILGFRNGQFCRVRVSFWAAVEKQLARLTNRISQDDLQKIRAALDKVVPKPEPEYAKKLEAEMDSFAAAWDPTGRVQETNKQMYAFSSSFKTAQACADCGGEMEEVYRERRSWKHRGAVGVLCKKCAYPPRGSRHYSYGRRYRSFSHYGPCETCGREVHISDSIPAQHAFCSTRFGQAYHRKARRLASNRRP